MRLFGRRKPASAPPVPPDPSEPLPPHPPCTPPPVPVIVEDWAFDDPAVQAARDAALRRGEWQPVADLLAATTGRERRGIRAEVLARSVADDPTWADRWLEARPGDPDALLVRGWGEVHRAWAARGSGTADTVADMGWIEFFDRLDRAFDLLMAAIQLGADDDPSPFVPLLWHGIGREVDTEEFSARFGALCAVDPLNHQGHLAALQYTCAKWHGSNHMMYEFARDAAAAHPGTWTVILPLQAHIEYVWAEVRAGRDTTAFWHSNPQLHTDIDDAAAWLAASPPNHPFALHDASVVGYCLLVSERLHEAARLFATHDQQVFTYPWYYEPDPEFVLAEFSERLGQGWGIDG